jgi:hypothetical protein
MRRVFADTFYCLALLNRHDPAPEKSLAFCGHEHLEIVTTEWVLPEVADANGEPGRRPGFQRLFALLERDEAARVIPATHALFRRGLQLFFSRPDKEWSLADCISFTVMGDEGLTDVLTGDRHFEQAGFTALLREKTA